MIYFLYGNDPRASLNCLNDIVDRFELSGEGKIPRSVDCEEVSRESLEEEFSKKSLFGGKGLFVLRHVFTSPEISSFLSNKIYDLNKSEDIIVIWERGRPIFRGENSYSKEAEKLHKLLLKESKKKEFKLKENREVEEANKNKIYSFADSLFKGNKKKTISIYSELLSEGFSWERIFWTVVWQIRNILAVGDMLATGVSENQIASAAKLHPYVVKKTITISRNISTQTANEVLKRLIAIDIKSKKTGGSNEGLFFLFLLKGIS